MSSRLCGGSATAVLPPPVVFAGASALRPPQDVPDATAPLLAAPAQRRLRHRPAAPAARHSSGRHPRQPGAFSPLEAAGSAGNVDRHAWHAAPRAKGRRAERLADTAPVGVTGSPARRPLTCPPVRRRPPLHRASGAGRLALGARCRLWRRYAPQPSCAPCGCVCVAQDPLARAAQQLSHPPRTSTGAGLSAYGGDPLVRRPCVVVPRWCQLVAHRLGTCAGPVTSSRGVGPPRP